jgi:hypothetical protein
MEPATDNPYLNNCTLPLKTDWVKVMYFANIKPVVNVIGNTNKKAAM